MHCIITPINCYPILNGLLSHDLDYAVTTYFATSSRRRWSPVNSPDRRTKIKSNLGSPCIQNQCCRPYCILYAKPWPPSHRQRRFRNIWRPHQPTIKDEHCNDKWYCSLWSEVVHAYVVNNRISMNATRTSVCGLLLSDLHPPPSINSLQKNDHEFENLWPSVC